MYTDEDRETLDSDSLADAAEDSAESALGWLLDTDLSDPEERLFTVEQESQVDTCLTEYELQVASRPMFRGSDGADHLESYVGEEIVMSSDSQGSDIYAAESSAPLESESAPAYSGHEPMAIDYSRLSVTEPVVDEHGVSEGADILGLADDDDMGEKYFVVKRGKPATASGHQSPATESRNQAPATESRNQAPATFTAASPETTSGPRELDPIEYTPEPRRPAVDEPAADNAASSGSAGESLVLRLVTSDGPQDEGNDPAADMGDLAADAVDAGIGIGDESTEGAGGIDSVGIEGIAETETIAGIEGASDIEVTAGTEAPLASLTSEGDLPVDQAFVPSVAGGLENDADLIDLSQLQEEGETAEELAAVSIAGQDGHTDEPGGFVGFLSDFGESDDLGDDAPALVTPDAGEGAEALAPLQKDATGPQEESVGALGLEQSDASGPSDDAGWTEAPAESDAGGLLEDSDGTVALEQSDVSGLLDDTDCPQAPAESDAGGSLEDSDGTVALEQSDASGLLDDTDCPQAPAESDATGLLENSAGPVVPEQSDASGLLDDTDWPEAPAESDATGFLEDIDWPQAPADSDATSGLPEDSDWAVAPTDSDATTGSLEDSEPPQTPAQNDATMAVVQDDDSPLLEESHESATLDHSGTTAAVEQVDATAALEQGDTTAIFEQDDTPASPQQNDEVAVPEQSDSTTLFEPGDAGTPPEQRQATAEPGQGNADAAADVTGFSTFADYAFAADSLDVSADPRRHEDAEIDDIFADFAEPGTGVDAVAEEAVTDDPPGGEQADSFDVFAEDFFAEDAASGETPRSDADAQSEESGSTPAGSDEMESPDSRESQDSFTAGGHLQLVAQPEVTRVADQESNSSNDFSFIPAGITFAQASPGGGEIFADFLELFLEEGSSELEKLEDAIASWEKDVESEDAFAVVSRILHTMKGIAKGVGLHFYGTLIHNFETLLSALPRPEAGAEGDYFRIVNGWLDACVRGLDHIQDARTDIAWELPQAAGKPPAEAQQLPEQAPEETAAVTEQAAVKTPEPGSEEAEAKRQAKQLSNKIADDGAKALAAQQSVRITSEKLDHLLNLSNQAQQLSVRTAQSVTRGKRASTEMQSRLASVRAHIAAIADRALRSVAAQGVQPGAPMDALEMDQYSELQEAANILREGVEDLADLVDFATRQNTQVEALLKHQTKVISSIGSSIRGARVVPVSRLVPGLRRLVRTVSVDLDKTVSFKVLNELGTLDRDDYARCQTILDHMVRNALDHGIEQAEERLAAGKSEEGLVTIDIRKAGADSVITLSDDGRGIDPQKMRESAIKKGLDLDVESLSDAEAVRLIFHKGFSTAGSISQISGRGVGMDIVLTELHEMGGDIQIESTPGQGTSFHIRVPSSVTVNGALLVSAGEQSYAIPLGGLIAVEQVPVEEFFEAVQEGTLLSFSGMECEPAYLANLCHSGHSLDANTWKHNVPVIIAGSSERYMAIAIDHVEEALEMVIRSLGPQFSAVPGVAGAATTASGDAIVALDLNVLVGSVGDADQSSLHVDAGRDEGLLVMVVDDSRTQRMVATSQLETVGVETVTAENGGVAIDLLNSADRLPDIILMDVEMPVKDGIQALREIRKSVRYGHVPVIMITSRTGLKHRAMAQAAGCNGYMGKPFNFRMLVGQINQLTGHRLELS